ncbi:conserved hypothetical protein [Leishmania major strain Friedlin]|uniref:CHAT domain-containing protein n=1 Tax=Leishmania major TaxID=5664 RepID=Q4QCJ7_LEIMA|nr:conserved hypothetical protein [Leishmania major strain Friedlin]CAG9573273.1 Leucine_Rich_repeat/CHAT_domain_containing_protein_-_putative [Leishmania major strain Friedlin]CAJ03792.1 conserved hypothetical protein [Leishmania major strain Friedlin]|eukprot:XP_001682951.1 conserved hypothetical protein [Leishmania major strain Friedlin]
MADTGHSTALPVLGEGKRGGNGSPATIAAPVSADGSMDHVALYRQFCAEEGCKANSAFLRYMQDRGGHFSLERLNLGSNYLGSKGLRPVIRMIDLCQTIVSINLENNGINNDAVMGLCEVLQRHVSITSLNLSHNPISVAGGKRLLQLVEDNPRITELLLNGTDIFEGSQSRIRMALQRNSATQLGSGPHMEVNKEVASPAALARAARCQPPSPPARRRGGPAAANTLPALTPPKATLQAIHHHPRSADNAAADGTSPGAASTLSGAVSRRSPMNGASSSCNGFSYSATSAAASEASPRYTWHEATLGKPQPRPPPPAVASQEHKSFSLSKVKDLKTLFAERARLLTEISRGEASRRAYAARQELMALERHGRPTKATASGAQPRTYPGAATTSIPLPGLLTNVDEEGSPTANTIGGGGGAENASVDTSAALYVAVSSGGEATAAVERSDNAHAATPPSSLAGATAHITDAPAPATVVGAQSAEAVLADGAALSVPEERPQAHTIDDVLTLTRMKLLTTEEQFTVLFDQGCREYMNRNLDAAYMAWNEAMRMAVREGQREWMAVVASNLQRLSYELLVEEGASHLEHGELDKALETFKLAYDVAMKAKNAAWERDMRTALQNVQKALFHRCHEAALLLFRRAQDDMQGGVAATTVTEDDYFVIPGTEEMVRHTAAFVREWSCLLLLKEAVGMWAEATRVTARLSEAAAAPLKECVKDAVSLVAAFIAEHHFNATSPTGLTWFGTDAYLYHECILLSELWCDLVAYSEQNLHHGLLSAICAAQLGELYVATFQLPQALAQLNKLVTYGRTQRSAVLEAAGLTLCGRVHLQRADYAPAEAALDEALRLWTELQSDPAPKVVTDSGDAGVWNRYDVALMDASSVTADEPAVACADATAVQETAASAPAKAAVAVPDRLEEMRGTTGHGNSSTRFRIETHLPTDAVSVLANMCRHYKVCLLLHTYRYSAALEALENSLNEAYSDTLREKLRRNFHLSPSLDEIAAIAGVLKTPLVFYTLTTRYDWAVKECVYTAEDSLCIWVVSASREMRFVAVNLAQDFKCTLSDLIASLRQRLCIEPEMAVQPDIITELPSRSWQEPLRVLYQACIHPIIGYVRALDSHLLLADGIITVVPSGQMWMVPFHGLLNVKAGDRYFVEEAAVQMAFSATQAAFAALSAVRVQQQDLHREVVAVQRDANHGAADALFYTPFPSDTDRSVQEGAAVVEMLSAGPVQLVEQLRRHSTPEKVIFTRKVELVEDVESLRTVLPRARAVHIATATTAAVPLSQVSAIDKTSSRPEDEGGLLMCTAAPMGDVGVIRAAEIAHMELAAEHVILTNTNMSPQHTDGIRDDVLGLLRGFFGSGVPCVIAGQWCTPDMKPMELFRYFYAQRCRPLPTSPADLSARTDTASGGSVSASNEQPSRAAQPQLVAGEAEPKEEGEMVRHRALLLARSIRHLLAEEPAMRYRPRVWAGYYCIGSGW